MVVRADDDLRETTAYRARLFACQYYLFRVWPELGPIPALSLALILLIKNPTETRSNLADLRCEASKPGFLVGDFR